MNAFERHGINHLSASSLNLWRASPGLWAARYLAGLSEDGPSMWRGSAAEAGLACFLRGGDLAEAHSAAQRTFELTTFGEISEEIDAERQLVGPMLERAAQSPWPGELASTQLRVQHWLDGVPLPLVGFLDFAFMTGVDVDLKTTRACPSKPRGDHVRQVSLYRAARKRRGGLLYVTGKRSAYFEVSDEQVAEALADMRAAASSLMKFLDRVENAADALSMLPIDGDDYRASPRIIAAVAILRAA